jgi:hypothetical protein
VVLKLVDDIRKDEPRVGTRKLHHRIQPATERAKMSIGRDRLFTVLRGSNRLVPRPLNFGTPLEIAGRGTRRADARQNNI